MTKNKPNKSILYTIWHFFTSVKLTVVILILIAVTSIVGTLVPQNASHAFYFHKYGPGMFKIFSLLNVFDMYHSWWFLTLLGLLSVCIVVCSIDRLTSTWKIIFPKKVSFNINRFRRLKNRKRFFVENSDMVSPDAFQRYFEKKFSRVVPRETENGTAIYAEKGRWTRLGVYVVHLSVLFLLFGGVIGGLFGFEGSVRLDEGEKTDRVVLRKTQSKRLLDFHIQCNSFDVTFYDTGMPQEFKTNLSIIENGEEVLQKDIIVNQPLRYRGINIFQSSYGVSSADSLKLKIVSRKSGITYEKRVNIGETIDLPEGSKTFTLTGFNPEYRFRGHPVGETFTGHIKAGDTVEAEVFMPVEFPSFDRMRGGSFVFQAADYEKGYYTGLQVTKDPGVIYVYIGFVLMIAGCIVTFFIPHQKILLEISRKKRGKSEVFISGSANRNSQGMKIKIESIVKQLKEKDLL